MAHELQPTGSFSPDTVTSTEVAHTENDLVPEKVIQDLQEGFRISQKVDHGMEGWGFVVTRWEEDLFVVETNMGKFHHPQSGFPDDTFVRKHFTVRRKARLDGPGSATRERWNAHANTHTGDKSYRVDYRIQTNKGGELEEDEFWKRYNGSTVDPERTQELYTITEEKLGKETIRRIRENTRMNWVANEQPDDHSLL